MWTGQHNERRRRRRLSYLQCQERGARSIPRDRVRATRSRRFSFSHPIGLLTLRSSSAGRRGAPREEESPQRREDEGKTRGVSGRAASTKRYPLPSGPPLPLLRGIPFHAWVPGTPSVSVVSLLSPLSLAGPKKTGRHGPDHEIRQVKPVYATLPYTKHTRRRREYHTRSDESLTGESTDVFPRVPLTYTLLYFRI